MAAGSPISAAATTTASTRSAALHLFQSSRIRHLLHREMCLQRTRPLDNAGQNIGGSCGAMVVPRITSRYKGIESHAGCEGGGEKTGDRLRRRSPTLEALRKGPVAKLFR